MRSKKSASGNSQIKIDAKIPIPKMMGGGRPPKYPWEHMKVGDSFLFPGSVSRIGVYSIAGHARKRYSMGLKIRKTEEGYRCWRVS